MKTLVLALVAVTGSVATVIAQEGLTYAGGSMMFSSQQSPKFGNVGPSFPRAGVGGTAIGLAGGVGRFLVPAISIGFEFSMPNRVESVQDVDYFTSYRRDNRHRDLILSALVGFTAHQSGNTHLTLVAGPSFVREDTLQRTASRLAPGFPFTGDFGPYGPETQLTRWTKGIACGLDVPVDVSRHVSIVPDVRMHWISRTDERGSQSGRLGLSSFVIRPGVSVRARF